MPSTIKRLKVLKTAKMSDAKCSNFWRLIMSISIISFSQKFSITKQLGTSSSVRSSTLIRSSRRQMPSSWRRTIWLRARAGSSTTTTRIPCWRVSRFTSRKPRRRRKQMAKTVPQRISTKATLSTPLESLTSTEEMNLADASSTTCSIRRCLRGPRATSLWSNYRSPRCSSPLALTTGPAC